MTSPLTSSIAQTVGKAMAGIFLDASLIRTQEASPVFRRMANTPTQGRNVLSMQSHTR